LDHLALSGPVDIRLLFFSSREWPLWGRPIGSLSIVGIDMWVEDWAARAACKADTPDALFVRGAEQNKAKQVCAGCPVRTECLAEALDNQIEWGVWGGMTERERRALLRRRPGSSWRSILETARTKVEAPSVNA
jgi:WhiB family redox-sensing transcriptional regulator